MLGGSPCCEGELPTREKVQIRLGVILNLHRSKVYQLFVTTRHGGSVAWCDNLGAWC
jgi:hypothetical protein